MPRKGTTGGISNSTGGGGHHPQIAARLAILLRQRVAQVEAERNHRYSSRSLGGIMRVAHQTGVSDRRISSILNGEQKTVSLGTADKILTKLGLSHLWYLDPEDGGFSDVIWPEPEDEKQAWA